MHLRPLLLMVLGHTVVDISQNILPVVLPLLRTRFGLSYAEVGLAAALLNLSSSVIQPMFGWISDRWGIQWFIPAGIVWTGILMGVVGLVPAYWALLLVLTLTGLGTAAFHPIAPWPPRMPRDPSGVSACPFSPPGGIWALRWDRS